MNFDYKNSTQQQLKDHYQQLWELMDCRQALRKEVFDLPEILATGEILFGLAAGMFEKRSWLIALTNRRVLLLEKRAFLGTTQVSIELGKINTVVSESGLMFGKLIIHDNGLKRTISHIWKTTATILANKINEIMLINETPTLKLPSGLDTLIDQLERLHKLKENGALTRIEFEIQKKILLDGQ